MAGKFVVRFWNPFWGFRIRFKFRFRTRYYGTSLDELWQNVMRCSRCYGRACFTS